MEVNHHDLHERCVLDEGDILSLHCGDYTSDYTTQLNQTLQTAHTKWVYHLHKTQII